MSWTNLPPSRTGMRIAPPAPTGFRMGNSAIVSGSSITSGSGGLGGPPPPFSGGFSSGLSSTSYGSTGMMSRGGIGGVPPPSLGGAGGRKYPPLSPTRGGGRSSYSTPSNPMMGNRDRSELMRDNNYGSRSTREQADDYYSSVYKPSMSTQGKSDAGFKNNSRYGAVDTNSSRFGMSSFSQSSSYSQISSKYDNVGRDRDDVGRYSSGSGRYDRERHYDDRRDDFASKEEELKKREEQLRRIEEEQYKEKEREREKQMKLDLEREQREKMRRAEERKRAEEQRLEEQKKREALRKAEEKKKQEEMERRRRQEEQDRKRRQEELDRKVQREKEELLEKERREKKRRLEELTRKEKELEEKEKLLKEDMRRKEEEKRQNDLRIQEETRRREEDRRRQEEEMRWREEQRRRYEEEKRQEELRMQEQELRRQEEEQLMLIRRKEDELWQREYELRKKESGWKILEEQMLEREREIAQLEERKRQEAMMKQKELELMQREEMLRNQMKNSHHDYQGMVDRHSYKRPAAPHHSHVGSSSSSKVARRDDKYSGKNKSHLRTSSRHSESRSVRTNDRVSTDKKKDMPDLKKTIQQESDVKGKSRKNAYKEPKEDRSSAFDRLGEKINIKSRLGGKFTNRKAVETSRGMAITIESKKFKGKANTTNKEVVDAEADVDHEKDRAQEMELERQLKERLLRDQKSKSEGAEKSLNKEEDEITEIEPEPSKEKGNDLDKVVIKSRRGEKAKSTVKASANGTTNGKSKGEEKELTVTTPQNLVGKLAMILKELPKPAVEPEPKTDKQKADLKKKFKTKYAKEEQLPDKVLFLALANVSYDESMATLLISKLLKEMNPDKASKEEEVVDVEIDQDEDRLDYEAD